MSGLDDWCLLQVLAVVEHSAIAALSQLVGRQFGCHPNLTVTKHVAVAALGESGSWQQQLACGMGNDVGIRKQRCQGIRRFDFLVGSPVAVRRYQTHHITIHVAGGFEAETEASALLIVVQPGVPTEQLHLIAGFQVERCILLLLSLLVNHCHLLLLTAIHAVINRLGQLYILIQVHLTILGRLDGERFHQVDVIRINLSGRQVFVRARRQQECCLSA